MMIRHNGKKGNWYTSLPFLVIFLIIAVLGSVFIGAYDMKPERVVQVLIGNSTDLNSFVIYNIRLPRILMSGLIGAGLGITGAAIQGLFRNPLADPSLIGISNGAMLFAVIAIVASGGIITELTGMFKQVTVMIAAFIGGVGTTYFVYFISKKQGQVSVMTMLLAGIAISAFAAAISGLFINIADDQELRDIVFWTLGSVAGATWEKFSFIAPVIFIGGFFIIRESRALNAILLGEKEAEYLGISVEKVKSRVILITALIVGTSVALTGIIGFIGLVIPHLLRLLSGTDYRYLLSGSALTGALFLVLADTLARTVIAPTELPIGILTAMIGAPFFLWLIIRSRSSKLII